MPCTLYKPNSNLISEDGWVCACVRGWGRAKDTKARLQEAETAMEQAWNAVRGAVEGRLLAEHAACTLVGAFLIRAILWVLKKGKASIEGKECPVDRSIDRSIFGICRERVPP